MDASPRNSVILSEGRRPQSKDLPAVGSQARLSLSHAVSAGVVPPAAEGPTTALRSAQDDKHGVVRETVPGPRPWLAAALWLALLGPGFFLVYGWCNAFTSHRPDVGSFFFAWERRIPFVPVMVIPYMSIDLFFAGSFFLCRSRGELRTHAWRIALAIVISAAGFLLFPLRYGWTRPAVGGWLGMLFAPLNALDQPYNLCPSLHISLRALLWRVYGRHLRPYPALWWGGAGWFGLIGVSTLLVYQHHVIDLFGGYLVAVFCRWAISEKTIPASAAGLQTAASPCPTLTPLPPSPPRFWRRWSKSSPAAACAGPGAPPAPASACISPITPAT